MKTIQEEIVLNEAILKEARERIKKRLDEEMKNVCEAIKDEMLDCFACYNVFYDTVLDIYERLDLDDGLVEDYREVLVKEFGIQERIKNLDLYKLLRYDV